MAYIEFLEFIDLALREAVKHFPLTPKVVGLHRELGIDSLGRDCVNVWVILDDATSSADLTPERLNPFVRVIQEKILRGFSNLHLNVVPYVYFRRRSEHQQLVG